MTNSKLNTLCSFFNYMAYEEIEFDKKNEMHKIIRDLEKHYKKKKCDVVTQTNEERATKQLKEVQQLFEQRLKNKEYSLEVFAILMLEYMLSVEEDTTLRVKFGHINLMKIIDDLEKKHRQLVFEAHNTLFVLIEKIKG